MIIDLDPKKVPLTEFMKALGYDSPVAADGVLRTYNAPYDDRHEPTMVINIETNLWRDTKSGASGGIYDLAYEMTGSCNRRNCCFISQRSCRLPAKSMCAMSQTRRCANCHHYPR